MFKSRYLTTFFLTAAVIAKGNAQPDNETSLDEIRDGGGPLGNRHPADALEDVRDPEAGPIGTDRHNDAMNIWAEPMERCSGDGMAMTGSKKTGYCTNDGDEEDFEVVCINIEKAKQPGLFYGGYDFCTVIGDTDPNWCDEYHPCHHDPHQECSVQNWCVDAESLAEFIHKAGGCDKIGELNCEATNEKVLAHYEEEVLNGEDSDRKLEIALDCIKQRCGKSVH